MARSQEKAMSTLNRWVDQKRAVEGGFAAVDRSSRLPSDCRSVKEAEAARAQVVRQLSTLIAQIQNAALGEQRIRDMNDEINRLMRLKIVWENQVRKLGGTDYSTLGSRTGEAEGIQIPGQSGYRYFGVARDLPGVREMLEQESVSEPPRRTRNQLIAHIRTDYYGWMDDEDPSLLRQEREAERTSCLVGKVEPEDVKGEAVAGMSDFATTATGTLNTQDLDKLLFEKKKQMLLAQYIVCLVVFGLLCFRNPVHRSTRVSRKSRMTPNIFAQIQQQRRRLKWLSNARTSVDGFFELG